MNVVIDAADPAALARFWSEALGWPITYEADDEVVVEPEDVNEAQRGQIPLIFVLVDDPKTAKNRCHVDLRTTSGDAVVEEADRLVTLGATLTCPAKEEFGVY